MTVVGGLRARLLQDSIQYLVIEGLTQIGWFDPGRAHLPILFLTEPGDWSEPIKFNAMIVSVRTRSTETTELGSELGEDNVLISVDIYAESESLAIDLANDTRDLLRGRLPFGATRGAVAILDFRMATPTPLGYAHVTDVRATRSPPLTNAPYTQHWFGVDINLIDTYYDSSEDARFASQPGPDLTPDVHLFPVP